MRRGHVHFVICVLLLGAFAVFMQVAQSRGALKVIKGALPIRKPLKDFDRSKLAPLELVNVIKLPQETVQELGTTEYLNWALGSPTASPRACSLSVTYYTGVVDQVPHVPEECFFQGAFTQASDDFLDMKLPTLGETIQVRRLSFYPPRDFSSRTFVYYTICVNGEFSGQREKVRLQMSNPFASHLYYSKVEVAIKEQLESRIEDLDEAARTVLDRAITELMKSHWPARGWERGGPPATTGARAAG
jgi:hypothetical protein